ncbi:MAG: hypothetical protein C4334_02800 [Pyrinomonas sp.]|mgnify:FL=1|uniref:hypothetical protein n=1 Tax=Pyrinomonas sp. TaxID=2080306 RepID=UPI0033296BE2
MPADEELTLAEEEAALVAAEATELTAALSGARREAALRLAEAARNGEPIPEDLLDLLQGLAVLTLQTGRARRQAGAHGEKLWTQILLRTARGRELKNEIASVNRALQALVGRRIEAVHVEMRTLGHFALTLGCQGVTITLAMRADGVRVESVSAG